LIRASRFYYQTTTPNNIDSDESEIRFFKRERGKCNSDRDRERAMELCQVKLPSCLAVTLG